MKLRVDWMIEIAIRGLATQHIACILVDREGEVWKETKALDDSLLDRVI